MAPHVVAAVASGKVFDNANPRAFMDSVEKTTTLDKDVRISFLPSRSTSTCTCTDAPFRNSQTKGRISRAQAASANGLETIGLYAAAMVAANHAGVDTDVLNRLTIGYVVSRFAYVFAYVNLGANPKTAGVRTAVWFAGIGAIFTLFIKSAQKLNA